MKRAIGRYESPTSSTVCLDNSLKKKLVVCFDHFSALSGYCEIKKNEIAGLAEHIVLDQVYMCFCFESENNNMEYMYNSIAEKRKKEASFLLSVLARYK